MSVEGEGISAKTNSDDTFSVCLVKLLPTCGRSGHGMGIPQFVET